MNVGNMSSYGLTKVSGTSHAHLGDVHHHHYSLGPGDELQECLRTLLLIDPRESKDALKSRKGNRVNGTCEWFLSCDDYALWRKSCSPSTRTFWLYGHPGTGKSTLSVFLVEALEEQFSERDDTLLAFFFCDGTSKYQNSVTAILRGLLYQLSIRRPLVLAQILLPEFRAKGIKLFDSFPALWRIFDTAISTITEDLFVFIDALDECDQASQELLLQQLELHNSNVRFFITSRPYPAIREVLEEFTCRDLASFKEVKADIDLFISEKVSKLAIKKKYTSRLRQEVTDLLTSRAEGTFLWVGLVCAEMQRLTAKAGLDLLKSLPSGLNLIYSKLFERAIADAIEAQEDTEDITKILKFVAVAVVPMTTAQLSSACNLYQDELEGERDLFMREKIEACRFMVVVDDKYVRLLHKSVKDFLFGSMTNHFPSLLGAHAELARCCVAQLTKSFRDIQTPTFSMSFDEFYQYSARNWVHHARHAQEEYHVPADQEEFFQHTSTYRDDWLSYLLATGEDIPPRFSLFDVAAKWGITSLLRHAISTIGDTGVTLTQFKDDVENGYGNPLLSAASCPYMHIFTLLLDLRAIEINGKLHLVEHLDPRIRNATAYRLPVNVTVMAAVCRNTRIGLQLVMSLMADRSREIVLNDIILRAIVSNESCGTQILRVLFRDGGPPITPTSNPVKCATRQSTVDCEFLDRLQEHNEENVQVSETKVESVLRKFDGEKLKKTLEHQQEAIPMSTELVVRAIQNKIHHNEVFMALLIHAERPVHISFENMKLIAEYLDSRVFTEVANVTKAFPMASMLKYAAANQRYGDEVVATILNKEPESRISETVLQSAAWNRALGGKILDLLLRHPPGTKVTAAVLTAAMNIDEMSTRSRLSWMPEEISPAVDDIEIRVAILLPYLDETLPFPQEALYGLVYHDANDAMALYSYTLRVIDLLSQKYKITLPDRFIQLLGMVSISDETLIAFLERDLIPYNEALLELVVCHFGIKALNYVLEHLTSPIESSVISRMVAFASDDQCARVLLSTQQDHVLTSTDRTATAWDLYYLRDTYQELSQEGVNLSLYSTVLHSDDDRYLQTLLDLGADPNYRHRDTAIIQHAIEKNRLNCTRALLRVGADMNVLPGRGTVTMSRLIRKHGRKASRLIQLMIDHGVNVNSETTQCETPLVAAVSQGLERVIMMLIRAGADVDAHSTGDCNCALVALARVWSYDDHQSHARVLHRLLQAGAHLYPELHRELLQRAVRDSNGEEIWLLARNIAWFGSDSEAFPLLGSRWYNYSSDTVCLLLRLGVDFKALTHWDDTVIRMAVQEGYRGVVSWFSTVSQDPLRQSRTPIHSPNVPEAATTPIQYNQRANLQMTNSNGETLLHLAAAGGQSGIMQWLLGKCTHDAHVLDMQELYGRTALHKALQREHYNTAKILIKHGASIDIPDGAGHTPQDWMAANTEFQASNELMKAVDRKKLAEIERLKSVGFEIESQRENFRTQGTVYTHQLGRLLYALGYHDEAARALEENIEHESDPPEHNGIVCDACDQDPIVGTRYICFLCSDCDICESCWEQRDLKIHPCCEQHKSDFVPIPRAKWKEDMLREPTEQWLERLMQTFWTQKGRATSPINTDAVVIDG